MYKCARWWGYDVCKAAMRCELLRPKLHNVSIEPRLHHHPVSPSCAYLHTYTPTHPPTPPHVHAYTPPHKHPPVRGAVEDLVMGLLGLIHDGREEACDILHVREGRELCVGMYGCVHVGR